MTDSLHFGTSFFSFAFFDVQYAMVRIGAEKPVFSAGHDLDNTGLDQDELGEFASGLAETVYFGRIQRGSGMHHLYVTPLVFGEKRLGYMAVATRQKLWKIFVQLLNEFENDYVDDQVIHVMAREISSIP